MYMVVCTLVCEAILLPKRTEGLVRTNGIGHADGNALPHIYSLIRRHQSCPSAAVRIIPEELLALAMGHRTISGMLLGYGRVYVAALQAALRAYHCVWGRRVVDRIGHRRCPCGIVSRTWPSETYCAVADFRHEEFALDA